MLNFLISEGYTHCLSKAEIINHENAKFGISLIPVKEKPVLSKHKLLFVAFYDIRKELIDMAEGVENAKIWLILEKEDISKMKRNFVKIVKNRQPNPYQLKKRKDNTLIANSR